MKMTLRELAIISVYRRQIQNKNEMGRWCGRQFGIMSKIIFSVERERRIDIHLETGESGVVLRERAREGMCHIMDGVE